MPSQWKYAVELVAALLLAQSCNAYDTTCRSLPGDHSWPTENDWAELNRTVGGRLIATIPQANICHPVPYGVYNATACEGLQETWDLPQT